MQNRMLGNSSLTWPRVRSRVDNEGEKLSGNQRVNWNARIRDHSLFSNDSIIVASSILWKVLFQILREKGKDPRIVPRTHNDDRSSTDDIWGNERSIRAIVRYSYLRDTNRRPVTSLFPKLARTMVPPPPWNICWQQSISGGGVVWPSNNHPSLILARPNYDIQPGLSNCVNHRGQGEGGGGTTRRPINGARYWPDKFIYPAVYTWRLYVSQEFWRDKLARNGTDKEGGEGQFHSDEIFVFLVRLPFESPQLPSSQHSPCALSTEL